MLSAQGMAHLLRGEFAHSRFRSQRVMLLEVNAHSVLKGLADVVDPGLALLVIGVAAFDLRTRRIAVLVRFGVPTVLAIGSVYGVQAIDRSWLVWQQYGGDYSTHTAFATALAVSLAIWHPIWRSAIGSVWLAYLVLIVFLGFHTAVDVASAAILLGFVTALWHIGAHIVAKKANERHQESSAA